MKLGDVLKKERERKGISSAEMAENLRVDATAYDSLESGASEGETWGPMLAELAIQLKTPVARLLAESGRSQDIEDGGPARLISQRRQELEKTVAEMAKALGVSPEQYSAIEAGESPLASLGQQLLAFAEAAEMPVFNIFYPCGLPFQELDDYP